MCRAAIRDSVFQCWTWLASFDFVGDLEFRYQVRRLNHCIFLIWVNPASFCLFFTVKLFATGLSKETFLHLCQVVFASRAYLGRRDGVLGRCHLASSLHTRRRGVQPLHRSNSPWFKAWPTQTHRATKLRHLLRRIFLPITSNDFAAAAVDTTLEKQEYWRNIKRTKNKNVFKQPLILSSCFRLDPFYMTQVPYGTFTDIPETLQ